MTAANQFPSADIVSFNERFAARPGDPASEKLL
jgi:hypothetical protein